VKVTEKTSLDGTVWDADLLRDEVRDYVLAGLGSTDAILVADDTQAIKKGGKSVGVAPQHCGLTNQIENCQVMPMLTYRYAASAPTKSSSSTEDSSGWPAS
jgi:SRSO17 transposase